MPVGQLPGGELLREQVLDLLLGPDSLFHQTLGGGRSVLPWEGQGVPDQLVQVPQGQGFPIVPGGQGHPPGKEGGVGVGEALIPQQTQQGGAELTGGNGVLLTAGDGDPALGRSVVLGAGDQLLRVRSAEPHQQLHGLETAGGAGQVRP